MRSTIGRLVARSLLLAAGIALATLLAPGRLQGATVWAVSFTIDDAFANAKVTSDADVLQVAYPYPDWRLAPDITDPYGCVEADWQNQLFFATLNRKTDAAGTRCNTNGSDRQFHIHLTAAPIACGKLVAAYGAGVTPSSSDPGDCELRWTANPRIRVSDLFKGGRVTSTPLAFLNDKVTPTGLSYEIQALTNVPMTAPSADRRVLTYDGQGMLYEFGNGKAKFVAEAFDLDLQMVFDRYAR